MTNLLRLRKALTYLTNPVRFSWQHQTKNRWFFHRCFFLLNWSWYKPDQLRAEKLFGCPAAGIQPASKQQCSVSRLEYNASAAISCAVPESACPRPPRALRLSLSYGRVDIMLRIDDLIFNLFGTKSGHGTWQYAPNSSLQLEDWHWCFMYKHSSSSPCDYVHFDFAPRKPFCLFARTNIAWVR